MSSLSGVFNSCATLIPWDVYREARPRASERQLVLVGQASTAVLVGLGLLWIPLMRLISGTLYQYIQSVQAYISPPIAAVFLLGVFWRRVNAQGAMTALILGFILGMGRLVAELTKDSWSGWMLLYADINFLHFAVLLFLICTAALVLVSLATEPPRYEKVAGLTYALADAAPLDEAEAHPPSKSHPRAGGSDPHWRRADLLLSVVLACCVGLIWWYFS
jgi:solute:Na+ symporter, SSS family